MIIKSVDYGTKEISAIKVDQTNKFAWIAFNKNTEGYCILSKVAPYSPEQIYYSLNVDCDKITKLLIQGYYIYALCNDTTNIVKVYHIEVPLTTYFDIAIPAGINEYPVDLCTDGIDLFILLPGTITGEYAKILKYTLATSTLDATYILDASGSEIRNAIGITYSGTSLWIATSNNPAELVNLDPATGLYSLTIMA